MKFKPRQNVTSRNADGIFLTVKGNVLTMAGLEGVIHFYNSRQALKAKESAFAIKAELDKIYPDEVRLFECWDIRNPAERA